MARALDRGVLLPEGRQEGEVSMRVGVNGRVSEVRIRASSGHAAMDTVFERAAMQFRFRPALHNREPVAVWVAQRLQLVVPHGPGR
jgi:TonB family protein